MKMKKALLAASLAAALGFGSAAQAVEVAANGKGQVLMAPVYYTQDGLKTKITIANPRTDAAVKVKVGFRIASTSIEAKDFVLFMTPGDAWTGTVETTGGVTRITSSDDSILSRMDGINPIFADVEPVSEQFANVANESEAVGHIEVIGAYAIAKGTYGNIDIHQGMSKHDLFNVMTIDGDLQQSSRNADGTINIDEVGASEIPVIAPGATFTNGVTSNLPDAFKLFGSVEVHNDSVSVSYDMTALTVDRTVDGSVAYDPANGNAQSYVISNPVYDNFATLETGLGVSFGNTTLNILDATESNQHILAIETAIASGNSSSGLYQDDGTNSTQAIVTFPTKYLHRVFDPCNDTVGPDASISQAPVVLVQNVDHTDPFRNDSVGDILVSKVLYDHSENQDVSSPTFSPVGNFQSTLPNETNFVTITKVASNPRPFTDGWYNLFLASPNGTNTCADNYTGVPALKSTLRFNSATGAMSIRSLASN